MILNILREIINQKNEELKFGNINTLEVRVKLYKFLAELEKEAYADFKMWNSIIDFSNDLNLIFKINNRLILVTQNFLML